MISPKFFGIRCKFSTHIIFHHHISYNICIVRRVLFLRHSKSFANGKGIVQSDRVDTALTSEGKRIVLSRAEGLRAKNFRFSIAYVSPTLRTKETLAILLEHLSQNPRIIVEKSLIERSYGDYDGQPSASLLDAFDREGPNPKGIESVTDFTNRIKSVLDSILESDTNKDILVVAHNNVLSAAYCLLNHPENVNTFWKEFQNPEYCEGFEYILS